MVLTLNKSSSPVTVATGGAALSPTQKTFFFAGFSSNAAQQIDICELHGVRKTRGEGEEEKQKCEEEKKSEEPSPSPSPSPPEAEPVKTECEDLHPDGARLNFYLLLMNSVRVVFTKTVAFSAMVTIKSLL